MQELLFRSFHLIKVEIVTLTVNRGGGIDRARRAKIFNYMYSTAPKVDSGCCPFLMAKSSSRVFNLSYLCILSHKRLLKNNFVTFSYFDVISSEHPFKELLADL